MEISVLHEQDVLVAIFDIVLAFQPWDSIILYKNRTRQKYFKDKSNDNEIQ